MEQLVRDQKTAEYFKELVDKALERQKLTSSELSSVYLVHLLDSFVRQDRVCGDTSVGDTPRLAELLLKALAASGRRQIALFKMTGDLSLFVSGFFSDSLAGKVVDADYYVQMGGFSYGRLAHLTAQRQAAEVFSELSQNFVCFVDVLNEVSEASALTDNKSLLRVYERWLRTGSTRSAELLRREGVLLVEGSGRVH